ncbi:MAG TPA: hypothetical protein VMF58_11380 [Rhizomicrobium sp.]|nr:hypothetical protein [Rhizomicrobium sp.]
MSYAASAAPNWDGPGKARPVFGVMKATGPLNYGKGTPPPAGTLTQWSGGFTDLTGKSITFRMAGADPSSSNTDTHIKTVLIPIIFVFGASNGNMTFDPTQKHTAGLKKLSVMAATEKSPIFTPDADFKSGSIDCGTGQYLDSFQRCNFWGSVSTNTGYHTILDVTKIKKVKPLTITVSSSQGKVINNPFGDGIVGTMSINSFDAQIHSYLTSHAAQITPDIFPLFVSYDIYLTQGGCCIGGYHSAAGTQTYGYSTFVDTAGAFSEDMSALSHEVGEWMDDPFTNNHVNCQDNSILEVGDPLETLDNYGTFVVKMNKIKWHPQELAMMPYFGDSTSVSANGWTSMHNSITNVCPGQ